MSKKKNVSVKMTIDQAAAVMLALIESQNGYADGPTTPERILNIREVIQNLDSAMEDAVSGPVE